MNHVNNIKSNNKQKLMYVCSGFLKYFSQYADDSITMRVQHLPNKSIQPFGLVSPNDCQVD